MEIRRISIDDAKAYRDFQIKIHQETDYLLMLPHEAEENSVDLYRKRIEHIINDKRGNIFIAVDSGKIVGAIWLSEYLISKRSKLTNFGLAVLKDYRRKGIAQQLFDSAEGWIESKNFNRVEITVIAENIPAFSFYLKNGFKQEGLKEKSIFMNNRSYDEIMLAKLY